MRAASLVLGLALLYGCAYLPIGGRAVPRCPGDLPAPSPQDALVARERVRYEHGDTVVHLDVVVQRRGDERVVIGLSPTGAKLFSAVQRGETLEIDALPAVVLAVPPHNVLLDVDRLHGVERNSGDTVRVERPACDVVSTWTLVSEESLVAP